MKLLETPRIVFDVVANTKHTKSKSKTVYTPGTSTWKDVAIAPDVDEVINVGDDHSSITLTVVDCEYIKYALIDLHIHTKLDDGNFFGSIRSAFKI